MMVAPMKDCTAYSCVMNGSNHQQERDSRPMYLCPVCLRKLLWNLQTEAVPYLRRLEAFCSQQGLEEADWYARAVEALSG
jgi:archaemetzincin